MCTFRVAMLVAPCAVACTVRVSCRATSASQRAYEVLGGIRDTTRPLLRSSLRNTVIPRMMAFGVPRNTSAQGSSTAKLPLLTVSVGVCSPMATNSFRASKDKPIVTARTTTRQLLEVILVTHASYRA